MIAIEIQRAQPTPNQFPRSGIMLPEMGAPASDHERLIDEPMEAQTTRPKDLDANTVWRSLPLLR